MADLVHFLYNDPIGQFAFIVGKQLPYDNLGQLRQRLIEVNRVFARPDRTGGVGRLRQGRVARQGALRLAGEDLLHDRPDQPRLTDHGAVRRSLRPQHAQGSDRHRWLK